jgi:hypothetical protein
MTAGIETGLETPRQYLDRLGVMVVEDLRPVEEIARAFGYIVATNLNTEDEIGE